MLRALAAIEILFAHLWPTMAQFGGGNLIPNFLFGASGVDLFFVISGFIMVFTSEKLFTRSGASFNFLKRRLIRIVPLYWLLTTVVVVVWYRFDPPSHTTWTNIVGSYFFIPTTRPNGGTEPVLGVGWTLNYEMFFYCLFAITIIFKRNIAVIVLSVLLVLFVNIPTRLGIALPAAFAVWGSSMVYEFAFGMWIALAFLTGYRLRPPLALALGAAGLALMVYTHLEEFTVVSRTLGWGGGAAMIVAAVTLNDSTRKLPTAFRPLVSIGDASYALYLFHSFVPIFLLVLHAPSIIDPLNNPLTYCGIIVILSLAGAFALNNIDAIGRTWMLNSNYPVKLKVPG